MCNLGGVTWVPGVKLRAALNPYYPRNEDDPKSDYGSLTKVSRRVGAANQNSCCQMHADRNTIVTSGRGEKQAWLEDID